LPTIIKRRKFRRVHAQDGVNIHSLPCVVENCSIYQSMVKNILIEKQAPLKQSFNYLCKKAHYNIL
jgi:hypothetical protein